MHFTVRQHALLLWRCVAAAKRPLRPYCCATGFATTAWGRCTQAKVHEAMAQPHLFELVQVRVSGWAGHATG
jgi:hypothetical protein